MRTKTAVDWLMKKITYDNNGKRYNTYMDYVDLSDFFIQAKELEKKQIIDSYILGYGMDVESAEELYKEKYE